VGGGDVKGGESCVVRLEEPDRGLRGGGMGADVVVVEDAVVGGNLRGLDGVERGGEVRRRGLNCGGPILGLRCHY
jgi:hypothetical protein